MPLNLEALYALRQDSREIDRQWDAPTPREVNRIVLRLIHELLKANDAEYDDSEPLLAD